mgnify:FL=1
MKLRQIHYSAILLCFGYFFLSGLTWANDISVDGNHSVGPTRSPELSNAIIQSLDIIERSSLLQSCMAEMLREGPKLCAYFNPRATLLAMRGQINASTNKIDNLNPANGVDLAPYDTLVALEAEERKIDDLLGVADTGLEGIERCSGGPLSPACTVLRSTCFGDWKCYGDKTCACYTCNKGGIPGSCGIE